MAVLLLCLSGSAWAEACHVIIREATLVKKNIDGKEAFVVDVGDVKPGQCFKPVETAQTIKKLQQQVDDNLQLAEAYQKTQEALQQLNTDYRQLIHSHEQTLEKSINLTDNFDNNMQRYNQLAKDYDQLTVKFDNLAEGYRDVALSSGSPIRVEIGAGLTNQGDGIALLGAGFNVYRTWDAKAWGVFHKDFSSVLGGVSFGF